MPRFRIGDTANGIETSEEIIEVESYVKALECLVESANLYCEPVEEESQKKGKSNGKDDNNSKVHLESA